jgi:Domain of unknown function (DUF4868)
MSDQKSALDRILQLNLIDAVVSVCLAAMIGNDDAPVFEKLQLSDELTEDFRGTVRKMIEKHKNNDENGDLVLRRYDARSKPESFEVEYVSLSDHGAIKNQVRSLSSVANLGIFDGRDDFVTGIRFYAIIVQPREGDPVYCFRSYSPKKELGRSRLFGALFSGGHFDRVREPMFLFDQNIDCVSRGDDMFIFNKDRFHKIFRFFEMVLKAAKTTLKIIKTKIPIANYDDFETACIGHLQMQAKLKNIAGKSDLGKIKMVDIKKVLREFPGLNVEITKKNGKEMLVFNPSDKWALLRLLDDDYLKSLMTDKNYEVTGKREYQ